MVVGLDPRGHTRERWLLPAVVLLVLLFTGWTAWVLVDVAARRRALEASITRVQALSALQRETARLLEENSPTPGPAWHGAAETALALLQDPALADPALASGRHRLGATLDAVAGDPSPQSVGSLQGAISALLATLRGGNARIAGELGERWDDLMRIALAALALAALNAVLLAYARRRRRQALALADEVTRAAEELAEARATLRERDALDRVAAELRASKALAEAALETKRRFTATMSHELLTPLNIVLGYADLLQERVQERLDAGDDPDHRADLEDLSRLRAAGQTLLRLVRQILTLTEIDDPEVHPEPRHLGLRPLLGRILSDLEPLAARSGNRIAVIVPAELEVWSDAQRLTTVLRELLDNASRFMSGGDVELRGWLEGDWVRVDVRDTGPGMPESERQRAFDPYFQGDSTASRTRDGAGLGLTVASQLCRKLGGRIELSSVHGAGTTVSLWLPRGPECSE